MHIHGCIDLDENFILGHGKTYEELERINQENFPEPPDNLSDEELAEFYEERANRGQELHEQLATYAAVSGVASQRKPVAEIIKKYSPIFESIKDVKYIHVYGLSLSVVDLPYLEYFASRFMSAHWEFNDYKNGNKEKIESFCQFNRIQTYSIIELENIQYTRQLCIDFLNDKGM